LKKLRSLITPHYITVLALVLVWALTLAAVPAYLPLHVASWAAFLALLIAPGYLLADMITWRLNLDGIERLALALPMGVAVLAIPGIAALLIHLNIHQLALAWSILSGLVILIWLLHEIFIVRGKRPKAEPWKIDELIFLGLILGAFILLLPTLNLYKIDGDAYAVNSFSADALAGLPLNKEEPIFGSGLGPGVRMVFNQSLTLNYLWSYFSVVEPNDLLATGSKAMLALWAILAMYMLGKSAGDNSRRFGLLTAGIQLLIYAAAPFVRGDNVSVFFFERVNADKFMVPVTMLPVIFALAISFVRGGNWWAWLAAAVATFAVSTIHPLIAAMLALALGSFALLHLLLNLRSRTSWIRSAAVGGLIAIVMFLPMAQLVLSRGESPLASSYPSSFEGWDVGEKLIPALPFFHVPSLDYYGPLPEMKDLTAEQANTVDNPFLIWRFALNMDRRRLILFDLNDYISDPSLVMEPPYFLALLLLPMFLFRLRRDVAAQYVVSSYLGVIFVMFNPLLTPLIGSFVMPWILWRFVWILPYALIFAMAAQIIVAAAIKIIGRLQNALHIGNGERTVQRLMPYGALFIILLATLVLSPGIGRNIRNMNGRLAFAYAYPTPDRLFNRLNAALAQTGPKMVLANQDMSVTLPAYVAYANVLAHRTPTTSEVFPADRQDEALQRLLDQYDFFTSPYLTKQSIETLNRYDAGYLIAESGSSLDTQLRLAPQWFTWLLDDEAYSLYEVTGEPAVTETILGNTAMADQLWGEAQEHFEAALDDDSAQSGDLLALLGLAEIAQREGHFDVAEETLKQTIAENDLPVLHYRLGRLYAQEGMVAESIAAFDAARRGAPYVSRFQIALADVCLTDGNMECAQLLFSTAANLQSWPDHATRLVAEADMWRQRGETERALPLYEQAAQEQPNEYNLFVLVSVYRELGLFDKALELVQSMRLLYPLSPEVISIEADLMSAQGNYADAADLLRYAILIDELRTGEATDTHLALGEVLLAAGHIDEADDEISYALSQNSYNATGHTLRGELAVKRGDNDTAIRAYQRAFELDPSQVGVYVALSDELRQKGGTPNDVMVLLQIALREDANEPTLLLALGDQWQRLGESDAAIDAYQAALEQLAPYSQNARPHPQSTDNSRAFAFSRVAAAYEDQGDAEAALNYYRSAIAAAPGESWTHLLYGDALRRQDNIDRAVHAYETALSLDENEIETFIRLANLYSATGDSESADSFYQRALDLTTSDMVQKDPTMSMAKVAYPVQTADALFASDETLYNEDMSAYTRPVDNNWPVDSVVHASEFADVTALARLYQGHNEGDKAIDLYLERIRLSEEEGESPAILARYYKELGDLYLARYDLDLAEIAYKQSLDLDSWTPAARLGLAETLGLQGNAKDQLAQLRTSVALSPGSVEAQIALANALDDQDKRTEAMTIYYNTSEKHPGNERATLALARAWQDRNRSDRAEDSFRETIAANPGAADAYVGLAELRMDAGDLKEAEELLTQARRIDYNNVASYIRLGELEQRRGNSSEALAWFQKAAALPAADQALNLTLIDSLIRYGDYVTALDYTDEALVQRENDIELLMRRGRIESIFGNYENALDSFTRAQATDPANSRIYVELANLYAAQGMIQEAVAANEQAISLDPTETAYYVAGSQWLAQMGNYDEAIEMLAQGYRRASDPALLYSTVSTLQLQKGQPENALQTLNDGLGELGETTDMLLAMGHYYENRGNFEQVYERYNQALESQPDVADVHIALGDLYLLVENMDEAILQYRQAITIDPATPGHYVSLGNAYEVAGDVSQAENAFRQALVAAPTLSDAYVRLGALYQADGKLDAAEEILQQGVEMSPASGALLIQYAALKIEQGEEDEARALANKAVDVSPTAGTMILRASILTELGDAAAAKRDLLSALAIEPAAIEALINLGDLYKAEGDRETAETYYTMAAETLPGVPTGYLRMATLAREDENRDAVVYWNDLARQAQPGGLLRPTSEDRLEPSAADDAGQGAADDAGQGAADDTGQGAADDATQGTAADAAQDAAQEAAPDATAPEAETGNTDIIDYSE
jgi:tetratricopeptide (TPR) repeat protein